MTELTFTYDEEELGWQTDLIRLTGTIVIDIELKQLGRVAIKKGNTLDGPFPKIYMSPITGPEHQYTISADTEGKYIRVITSEEPKHIRYYEL